MVTISPLRERHICRFVSSFRRVCGWLRKYPRQGKMMDPSATNIKEERVLYRMSLR